ncbi:MAG: hypothetical protein H0X24_09885 [Ktedonobacterales bacterium]|nr:hypothetical protein [Ktedonobacterales bacterium]
MPDTIFYLRTWPAYQSRTGINISIDPAKAWGKRGTLGIELSFPYTFNEPGGEVQSVNPLALEGEIRWSGDNEQMAAPLPIPSQIVWPQRDLSVPLTLEHIEAIENARKGGAVNIAIILRALTAAPGIVLQSASPGSLTIERERWLLILEQLGRGSRRLVELPDPQLRRDVPAWRECQRLLDKATQAHRTGDYETATDTCREIIEGIPHVLVAVWGIPDQRPGQSYADWLKEMERRLNTAWTPDMITAPMLRTLLSGTWNWLAPGPHYGTGIPQREQVIFILGLCTDVLHFAAQALQAHPAPIPSPP